jgi:hypothetical protein
MPKPIIAWSYSTITTFENCPYKLWAVKIKKLVSDVNASNDGGDREHKAFENYGKKGILLPAGLQQFTPMIDKVKAMPGEKYFEYSMTLTEQFIPTKWNDWDNAWVRGAADFLNVNGDKAHYLDWKSGKFNASDDQIELSSLLIFRHFPAVQQVTAGLVFYNKGRIHPHVVHRSDESRLWNHWISRLRVLEAAVKNDEWPKTPNPLCGYCPVKTCPHNTNKS